MNIATDGKPPIEAEIEKILLTLREKEKIKLIEWKGWPPYAVLAPSLFTRQHPADIRDWGINE